jgi:hypothetical protein
MKKLLLLIVLFCASLTIMAQDVIVKKDGSTILSKVLEIGETEIKYKKWSNQDGPTYTIHQSEILRINYQNGETDSFYDENSLLDGNMVSTLDLPIYVKGELKHVRRNILALDGKVLSDDEAKRLLGTKAYEDFLKGVKLGRIGDGITLPGALSFVGGLCLIVLPVALSEDQGIDANNLSAIGTIGIICFGVGGDLIITGSIVAGTGKRMIRNIVTEYNGNNNKVVSFNVLPSIMSTKNFGQNDFGLGLTFSMSF